MTDKTAMQELIERLQNLSKAIPMNTAHNRAVKASYVHAITIAKDYIELEKQQITDAVEWCMDNTYYRENYPEFKFDNSEDYYNQTFK